jgi:hypothetical protein
LYFHSEDTFGTGHCGEDDQSHGNLYALVPQKKKIVTCDAVSFQEMIFSRYSLIFKVLTPGNKFSCWYLKCAEIDYFLAILFPF